MAADKAVGGIVKPLCSFIVTTLCFCRGCVSFCVHAINLFLTTHIDVDEIALTEVIHTSLEQIISC